MADNFVTLYNRLLNRAPEVGVILSQQLINDSWRTLQARKEWSWRRRSSTFAPPDLYLAGSASTNVAAGNPTLITGSGTAWTPAMVGRQIRLGGLLYPFYTIVGYLSPTALLIDQPWAGNDVASVPYNILQIYYPVPDDFGYFYTVISIKDAYRLWTNVTEADLSVYDPQRTNQGQTYAVVFRDYQSQYGGIVGPVIPVTNPAASLPISTTSYGFSYPANATYIVQVVNGGASGVATFQWLRAGQTAFQPTQTTDVNAQDLSDGVQIYWPTGQNYTANDLYVINCTSLISAGVPRYELWPGPTFSGYLYPYIYIAKEYDLTPEAPNLPPFVANRGEILLEMALEKAAMYPGTVERPNPYYSLDLAKFHRGRFEDMMVDFERNDEEVGVTRVDYQNYPYAPAPWYTGQWQQTHSPWLQG